MISLALTYLLVVSQVNAASSSNSQAVGVSPQFERRHEDGTDHSHHHLSASAGIDAPGAGAVDIDKTAHASHDVKGVPGAGAAGIENAAYASYGVGGATGAGAVGAAALSGTNGDGSSKVFQTMIGNQTCEVVVSCSLGQASSSTCVTSTMVIGGSAVKPTGPPVGHAGHGSHPVADVPSKASAVPEYKAGTEAASLIDGSSIPDVIENMSSGGSMKYAPAFAALVAIAGSLLI